MENQVVYRLVEEVRLQCKQANYAFQNIRGSLSALDSERVFFFVDGFVGHAVQVSRLFWPDRAASKARGERLRSELKVDDQSPLRLHDIREAVQHPDEYFEDWLKPLENRGYVDMNIMPVGAIGDFKPDKFHRSLDPETFHYHLRGIGCPLRSLADELARIEAFTQAWLKTHTPW